MGLDDGQMGDMVFAVQAIHNDGSLPEHDDDALLVPAGVRGVIVNIGHLESNPAQVLYLVRFENPDGVLGPPLGCWPDDLANTPPNVA
jgi:nitrogen fixation protein NifZ